MLHIFFLLGNPMSQHPSVPVDDVMLVHDLICQTDNPLSLCGALLILRRKLFPFCYDPSTWVKGRSTDKII